MIWYVLILHILLAILLFFIVNWLGAHSSPMGYMQLSLGMQDDTSPAFNLASLDLNAVRIIANTPHSNRAMQIPQETPPMTNANSVMLIPLELLI